MPFSFDTTIAIAQNAANELTRAARDLGDEMPDHAISTTIADALETLNAAVTELTALREFVAAGGTSADFPTKLDVKRRADGMAEPGADMVEMPDGEAIAADQNAKLRAAVAANPPVEAVVVPPAKTTAKTDADAAKTSGSKTDDK